MRTINYICAEVSHVGDQMQDECYLFPADSKDFESDRVKGSLCMWEREDILENLQLGQDIKCSSRLRFWRVLYVGCFFPTLFSSAFLSEVALKLLNRSFISRCICYFRRVIKLMLPLISYLPITLRSALSLCVRRNSLVAIFPMATLWHGHLLGLPPKYVYLLKTKVSFKKIPETNLRPYFPFSLVGLGWQTVANGTILGGICETLSVLCHAESCDDITGECLVSAFSIALLTDRAEISSISPQIPITTFGTLKHLSQDDLTSIFILNWVGSWEGFSYGLPDW